MHHRRSIRLKDYDYTQPGHYFITVCTHNRELLFSDNRFRTIAEEEWLRTETIRDYVCLDEFIVMPNYIHGIIRITPDNKNKCSALCTYQQFNQ